MALVLHEGQGVRAKSMLENEDLGQEKQLHV